MGRPTYLLLTRSIITAAVILLLGGRLLTAQTVNVTEPTYVIAGDDLQSLGVARLSDLLNDVADARTLSLDGFTTQFRLSGIGSFHDAPPVIFVDGHPIELGFLASSDLNLIGLPAAAIDRVEIYARPSLISGVFAGQGAIHIVTKQASDGAELHGSVLLGANDSDAGHLDFSGSEQTPHGLEGPDVDLTAMGEIADGSALAAVAHRRHAHADRSESSRRPLTATLSPSVVYTWSNPRVHLSATGHGVTADRFAYAPYASRVVATDHQGAAVSAIASHRIGNRGFLRHRATVDLSRSRYGQDLGSWKESSVSWASALARTLDERIVVLGGTAALRRIQAGASSADVRWGSVFAAIAGRMAPGTTYRGGGTVAMDGRSVAVKAYGGITLARWTKHRADVYITVVDALLHEQNAADLWAREELIPPLFPNDVARPNADVALKATFDAEWRWQPDALQELRLGAGIRRSERIYLPLRTLIPVVGGGLRESIEFDYTDGTQGVVWGEFTTHVLPGRQRFFWNWQHTMAGKEAYRAAWSEMPDSRFGVSLTSPMVRGFRMRGGVLRESGSTWHEFDTAPPVDSDLSGNTQVDIYIAKRLFSGRLDVAAGVQNVLGDEIRIHPLGDAFGRSIRVDIRLDLVRRP